jgi:hypothetical protein
VTVDRWAPPLVLSFLVGGEPLRIEIGGEFAFRTSGKAHRLDPEGQPFHLAPVLALIGRTVDRAEVSAQGGLQISFSGGYLVEVDEREGIEAWYFG